MAFFNSKDKEKASIKKTSDNPYLDGREEWLERYGNYIKARDGWRFFAIISWLIAMICIGLCGYMATQNKIIPYVVEVDKLGRANAVSAIDESKRTNLQNVIPSVVSMIISDWRTVTADVLLQKKMIGRLSYFTTGSAKGYFKEWYEKNNPYERGKENLVSVELKSLPLAISQDSYKVEWTEIIRNHAGKVLDNVRYEATVTIQMNNPTSEQMILNNPTGIFISYIDATKLF